eukprot:TRINITY_DN47057_c0_g1_i1.p1 TRINITY_DN47057_c0_g1~~TRINITY_DN47057_c0_g1_i1.p1  ORF type:complete len:459 (+),score=112.91 TRINITY_DN47057_c0_g1_i1:61-1437(+)
MRRAVAGLALACGWCAAERNVRATCDRSTAARIVGEKVCWDGLQGTANGTSFVVPGVGPGVAEWLRRQGCSATEEEAQGLRRLPPQGYTPPDEMLSKYTALATEHPSLAKLINLNDQYGTALSHDGHALHVLKVSDHVGEDEDEKNALLFSNIHANELQGAELNYYVAEKLLTEYNTVPGIRALVDSMQLYILVTGNPDGVRHVWSHNSNWRKNRRVNADGTFGVDMNRNYPFGWDFDSCKGSDLQWSGNYRGPAAASEPEVQTIMAFQTDRNFDRVFDFHTGCGPDVRYNYASADMLPKEIDELGQHIAGVLAAEMGIGVTRALNCGTEPSFAYHNTGSISFLSEISRAHQPSGETMRGVMRTSWPGVYDFLTRPTPAAGRVTDAVTGAGVSARLELPGLGFKYEERKVTSAAGRFHLWLPDGTYTLTVTAEGYATESVEVNASVEGTWAEVKLRRQ